MKETATESERFTSPVTFAVAAASTAGRSTYDNVKAYPKLVTPSNVNRAGNNAGAFNSGTLTDAVNKLVGFPPFNVPASGVMGILSNRTVANQGFAA